MGRILMRLPYRAYKKRRIEKLRICHEPGCGKEFYGPPIAKYCDFHRDIRNRVRKRKKISDPSVENMLFDHSFREVIEIEFTCPVIGCGRKFIIKIYPKQLIYPKFCEEHRSAYRRRITEVNYHPLKGVACN